MAMTEQQDPMTDEIRESLSGVKIPMSQIMQQAQGPKSEQESGDDAQQTDDKASE